jgi:hypothetical protein
MFPLLKIAAQFVLAPYKIVDKASWRSFLLDIMQYAKSFAKTTGTKLDDVTLMHIEFMLKNDAVFDYVYRLIAGRLGAEAIVFEAADENTVADLLENIAADETPSPKGIKLAMIMSIISQIISIIDIIKNQ